MRIRRRLREQYTGIVPGTGNGVPQGDEAQQLEEVSNYHELIPALDS